VARVCRNRRECCTIDFQNASYLKLKPVDSEAFSQVITPMFANGEFIVATFKGARDGVVFTNKRIITINLQGITGKKKDFTTLPFSRIQAFSVETAGTFDLDSELELWFSGLGRIRLEFAAKADITSICRMISDFTLGASEAHSPPPAPTSAQ
jgi:hypothetical protein